jgi:hypothetical protein
MIQMDAHIVNLVGTLLAHVFRLFIIVVKSVFEELWDKNGIAYLTIF